MLADRQEFDMREAHLGGVIRKLAGERRVVQHLSLERAPPASQVHLVDRNRLGALIGLACARPGAILPFVADLAMHDRGGFGRHLRGEPHRIRFQRLKVPVSADDLVLVELALRDSGDKDLPHAGGTAPTHRVAPPVPGIEMADHRNPPRVGRPDGKGGAVDALMRPGVRAEAVIHFLVPALAEQILVKFAHDRTESIRIEGVPLMPQRVAHAQAVGEGLAAPGQARVEEALGVDPIELADRFPLRVQQLDLRGVRHEDIDDHRTGITRAVHAEDAERIAVLTPQDRLDLDGGRSGFGMFAHVLHSWSPSVSIRPSRPRSGMSTQCGRIRNS